MRVIFSLALGGFLIFGGGWTSAQKSISKKEKKPEEPTLTEYDGKSVEDWIKAISSRDCSKGEKAIQTVQRFRARSYEAIPALLAELEKHSVSYPIDISIRVNATVALGNIFSMFDDPQPKHVERALKVLSRLLNDGQAVVKTQAALALGKMGPAAAAGAIPALLITLRNRGTWEVRQAAAMALGSLGRDPFGKRGPSTEAIVGLGKALAPGTEPASAVRMAAIQSLIVLGDKAAPSHQKQLVQFLEPVTTIKEPEPAVRIWAHMAVMQLSDEVSEPRLASIARMLDYPDPFVRIQAAQALGRVGPKAQSAVGPLISALKDRQADVVMTCLWALGQMENSAMAAVPALKLIVADPKRPDPMKKAAALVIDTIEGKFKVKTKEKSKTAPTTPDK